MSRMTSKNLIPGLALALFWSSADAAQILSIDFNGIGAMSEITITGDAPVRFEQSENAQDKQLVLNLKGATLAKNASRKLDTSSFASPVTLVSPYLAKDGNSRIVVQFRENVTPTVTSEGNTIRIRVPNAGGDTASSSRAAESAIPPAPELGSEPPLVDAPPADPAPVAKKASNGPLEELTASMENRQFTGRPITLQVRDSDLTDVFRLIAEASGFNIIVGEDVKGKVTTSMIDVPWDQALDTILHTNRLGAERNGNILRIVTLDSLTKEKQAEMSAKLAAENAAPRITQVFPINFANLEELAGTLGKFVGSPTVGPAAAATATNFVQPDRRTNSLIIRDIPDNLSRMKKLIELLDVQTPQVLIEAKVVEVSEEFTNAFGGNLGLFFNEGQKTFWGASFSGGALTEPGALLGSITPSAKTSQFGFGRMKVLGTRAKLNSVLSLSETENKVKIVASPRTVVLNKETANILQSQPVLVPVNQVQNGITISTNSVQDANLSLQVTPIVTNEGTVLMNLNVSRDTPESLGGGEQQGVSHRNMTSKVLVESGSTIVMGGIYTSDNTEGSSGFPLLRKIPIVGWFFGNETSTKKKSELFFFITPRILNSKEAGLVESSGT